jgi:hypothetical protein
MTCPLLWSRVPKKSVVPVARAVMTVVAQAAPVPTVQPLHLAVHVVL